MKPKVEGYIYLYDPKIGRRVVHVITKGYAISLVSGRKVKLRRLRVMKKKYKNVKGKTNNKRIVKIWEIRHVLWECQKKLLDLQGKADVRSVRYKYIKMLWIWIWALRQIQLEDTKNIPLPDYWITEKIRKGWLKEKLEGEVEKNG